LAGEGCFYIRIQEALGHKLKEKVGLSFFITQHNKDERLMRSMINYLGCGNIQPGNNAVNFRVDSFLDINEKVIPFFGKYPILGAKSKDFADWCKAADIIKAKEHLTKEGLDKIKIIKTNMNRGRC